MIGSVKAGATAFDYTQSFVSTHSAQITRCPVQRWRAELERCITLQ